MSASLRLIAIGAAGVLGAVVSAYLVVVHAAPAALACSTTGFVNCDRVLSSGFAAIGGTGIPTATAGLVWFPIAAGLALVRLSRVGSPVLVRLQLLWSGAGLAVVLGLVFVEVVLLGAICAWCTVAHVLVLLIFLASVADDEWALERE